MIGWCSATDSSPSATDQAMSNFCHASNLMCVEATGLECVFEDSLRRFEASIGVIGCCSATGSSLSATGKAISNFCHASNLMCVEATGLECVSHGSSHKQLLSRVEFDVRRSHRLRVRL